MRANGARTVADFRLDEISCRLMAVIDPKVDLKGVLSCFNYLH